MPQPDASMTVSPEAPRPVQAPLKVPVRKQWKHRFASNSWAKEKDRKRRKSLEMWLQIVQRDPFSTTVGMQIHGMTNSEMLAVLADVFRSKATATLFSRAGSVLAFIRWGIAELGEAFVLFPTDEGIAYEYICHLRDERAPATKAQRFLQALAFSGGLLGVNMKETLGSRRLHGGALPVEGCRSVRKKDPFTVQQLVTLERAAASTEPTADSIFAGFICFLVHARLRWSDGQHVVSEPVLAVDASGKGTILGAMVSLKNAPQGEVCVFNKPERVPDIVALFRDIASGSAPLGKLPSLRGKLLYAAGHTFGRMTHLAVRLLSRMGNERNRSIEDLIPFIGEAVSLLQAAAPRVLKPMMCERPILLFTDGACEDEGKVVTHGAMLFDPHHGIREYFGDHVPRHLAEQWSASGSKQLIAQAELLPVVVAKRTWSQVLKGRKVLVFIDNEGVKASLVRSFSPSLHTLSLLKCNAMLDTQFQMWNWYSRVPSASNPADAASRLEFKGYDGWRKVTPDYSDHAA